MEEEFIFKPSAFKHGIAEEDIRNAFERRVLDYAMPEEENKNLLLGLARDGSLLEIIYNVFRACPKNCVNGHSEVKYGHGKKKGKERKGHSGSDS